MTDFDINNNEIQVKIMVHITGLFKRIIALEDIEPSKETYGRLIKEHQKLLKDLLVVASSISAHANSDFTKTTIGMLDAMINSVSAEMEYVAKLKNNESGDVEYSDAQQKRDTYHIGELIKERQRWGTKMNKLNRQIMSGENSE